MKSFFLVFFLLFLIGCCKEEKTHYKPHLEKETENKKEIHLQNATSYIGSGSYSKAEKEIKEAIKIDPKDYKSWLILGGIYDKMNEDKKAIEAYIVGIRLKPRKKDEKIGTSSLRNPFQPMRKRETSSKP